MTFNIITMESNQWFIYTFDDDDKSSKLRKNTKRRALINEIVNDGIPALPPTREGDIPSLSVTTYENWRTEKIVMIPATKMVTLFWGGWRHNHVIRPRPLPRDLRMSRIS